MGDRIVQQSRDEIARIDARAEAIKSEVSRMFAENPRMQTDETYRNQVIGPKLREIQDLQLESQSHQKVLMDSANSGISTRMTTRSRATAHSVKLTDVAAKIQQASREAQSTTVSASRPKSTSRSTVGARGSNQSASITSESILAARNWLIERENALRNTLESELILHDRVISREDRDDFALIQGIRVLAEELCGQLALKDITAVESSLIMEKLSEVIRYVSSRQ
jgi:hypothetical protein